MTTHHVVALSGGKDSTAMALGLRSIYPSRAFQFVITPTGDELPEMEEHWCNLERLLDAPLLRLGSIDLLSLIREQKMIPNFRARFCTRILKIEPFLEYMRSLEGEVLFYVGLRADEESREGASYDDENVKAVYPLREWGWGLGEVLTYLEQHEVKVPVRTDCGACFYQRLGEWQELWRERPERFAVYEQLEAEIGHTFRSPQRDTWPAGLKELRQEFEKGREPRAFTRSTGPSACPFCAR